MLPEIVSVRPGAPAQATARHMTLASSGTMAVVTEPLSNQERGPAAATRYSQRMPSRPEQELLTAAGRAVAITNPHKVLFPQAGHTKLDLARYYLAVAEGALRGSGGRPNVLVRHPNGVGGEFFYQKRAPTSRPDWIEVVELKFPSGRTAEEVVPRDAASLVWMANLACLELHPHPVRADDLDHPDELRIDLDPVPGITWDHIRQVAHVVRAVLDDMRLIGWPKTSGSRGMHIYVRIERRWSFDEVRRAALALAREVERRAPTLATSKWWKEERHGVFLDYNQNAKDRTVAGAYSVRATADARVSAPLAWDEIDSCDPADFTLATMPDRFAHVGDRHASMDAATGSLERLLQLSVRHEKDGEGDAPWPPHYRKQPGEAPRVAPSKARRAGTSRRTPKFPLIEIARAREKADALAGVDRWKARYPDAAAHLEPADVLVDAMRGRFRTWTRIRINLQHVPEALRPPQEALDPNEDINDWAGDDPAPWEAMKREQAATRATSRRTPAKARTES
jgi:DNA ligase D-like protein (predicted polymerase)